MQKTIIVSYSGGLGSFYAAHLCKIKYPETEIKLVFTDTLIEDPDLYRFLRESAKALNLELIEIADGRNPWQVFEDVKLQGNSRIAPCSKILKRETFNKWIKENYPNGDFVVCLGIGWEESERLERAKINNPYEVIAPLCDKPFIFPEDKEKILSSYGIEKPRLYDLGFSHNNCGGFCVRAGLAHFKNLYEKLPEVYLRHEQEQEDLIKKNPKLDKPFLKKTINKKTEYLSLKAFREKHLELNEIERNDFGGCGCFVDD